MNAGMTDDKFINMVNHARRSRLITAMVAVYKKPLDFTCRNVGMTNE